MEISLDPAKVELLPGRAVFLPASQTLVVADLHLGKSATFRKRGLPVPEGSNEADLARLQSLVDLKKPDQLVIAGDLFHSADGMSQATITTFHAWLKALNLPVILTEGNHDRRSWFTRHKFPIEVTPGLETDDLIITHDPADIPADQSGIAGHIHPGVRIRESARQSLRITGFFLRAGRQLILPAFSEFTGIHPLKMTEGDQFFAEIHGEISEIPSSLIRA
ncbi:ligase-associated DNA damage response endonuclease PdeM [Akkermansiaceae bacterium]|nr:ligase-associated DNA damage response endonuclease PdeM [Akkermansiaceae bacterium]